MHKNILLFLYLIILFLPLGSKAESGIDHKIAVLVNEEIITSYDIIQRLKLEAIIQNININEQNNQVLFNSAVDDLIYEKLKFEKINEYKIKADDNEYLEFESNFFERNKIDKNLIVKLFDQNNINYSDLERRLASELLWNKLIGALYYRLTSVSELEIDEISKKNPLISYEQAQNLVIQRQLDLQSSKLLRDMMNEATIEYR
jgi:peptidyl-prolyl cis-trans isomerase SurA